MTQIGIKEDKKWIDWNEKGEEPGFVSFKSSQIISKKQKEKNASHSIGLCTALAPIMSIVSPLSFYPILSQSTFFMTRLNVFVPLY